MPNSLTMAIPKSKASNEPYHHFSQVGRVCLIYLLTGPFTGIITGLYKAGRAAMAEELNWDVEAFDLALGEAIALGMVEADLKARVFWLPNELKNKQSVNTE